LRITYRGDGRLGRIGALPGSFICGSGHHKFGTSKDKEGIGKGEWLGRPKVGERIKVNQGKLK